jgi:hypothetical protein
MKKILFLGFVAVAGLFLHACGSSDSAVAELSPKHDGTYTGAGSVWTWTLTSAGAFTAVKKLTSTTPTDEKNIVGTYETYPTGFYKFTVTSATGTDGPSALPSAGDTAYGFAVPNLVLIVKPSGSGSETLVMPVLSTTCPTFPVSFNWVEASLDNASDPENHKYWGNATIPSATGDLSGMKWSLDGSPAAMNPETFTGCVDGKLSFGTGFVSMTSSGVGIVNNESGGGDIIAFPRDTAVTEATLRSRTYVGLVFIDSSNETKPVNFTIPATGDGTYEFYTDVTTAATGDTGPLAISSVGTGEQAGFVKLSANGATDANPPTMWAAVSTLGGRTTFFAAGYNRNADGSSNPNDSFSLIAVEK